MATAGLLFSGCGSSGGSSPSTTAAEHTNALVPKTTTTTTSVGVSSTPSSFERSRPALIAVLPAASRAGLFRWVPAVAVRGQPAVWISRIRAHGEAGFTITLLRFDQRRLTLALHAGGAEPGGSGWRHGSEIGGRERRTLVAAFNGAFRESYGAGGFVADGRVGWPLRRGTASVVIYRDGSSDIGRWHVDVPASGRPVTAVRQNLGLLIDGGHVPSSVDTCIRVCWGDPLHEQPIVARSALGITADGALIWAAGHDLSVRALADALVGAGAVRAIEMDINPRWVAGYLYAHHRHGTQPAPIPVVPGQTGIPGEFMQPYFRDFFSLLTRAAP